jgi:predicted nucleic acid-binding protein
VAFVVIYDANVLYPSYQRSLLIEVARAGLVRARWTEQILDEVFQSLKKNRSDLNPASLDRTRALMNAAIRDVLVTGYEPLIESLDLPDPDDRHVLAAAIKVGAQTIVTNNLRDFPAERLGAWDIEASSADDFLHAMVDLNPKVVFSLVQKIANSLEKPPMDVNQVLDVLSNEGLVETVAALRS